METLTTFNKIIFIFGIFCIKSISSQIQFPNEDDPVPNFGRCTTPNGERALCIYLEDCQYLYKILLTTPLLDSDRRFLSLSQCGYKNGRVLICCPDRHREVTSIHVPAPSPSNSESSLLPQPGQCGTVLSNRIYGGNVTKIDEFPWMALIEYTKSKGNKGHHCGGSLINSRYVITASHCVIGRGLPADWKLTSVRLGEWDTKTNPDCEIDVRGIKDCAPEHLDVAVEKSIPHPNYNPDSRNQANDVALLRLAQNVAYTDFIRPLCLPITSNLRSATLDGIVMNVAGWGKTERESASSLKLKANVEGVKLDECRSVYGKEGINLEETHLCAGGKEGIDSCRGDSGGPLISLATTNKVISYHFLAGVVSFGPTPCGLSGWPGVYTRIGSYIDWIQNTIEK